MSRKRIAAIAAFVAIVLVGGAFLAGYLPERRRRTAAEQESSALREQLTAAAARVRLGQLLGQALAVRDAVVRQNYGRAQELASTLFDSVRREAAATLDEYRPVLDDVLSRRDSVIASLAKAEPGVLEPLRMMEVRMRRALGYPVPEDMPEK